MVTSHRVSTIRIVAFVVCCLLEWRLVPAAQVRAQAFSGPYKVSGVVVSKVDGHLLSHARITLADTKIRQKFRVVITSDDGRFVFPSVPAGKFSLTGTKRGFIPAAYDQHDQFSTAMVIGAGMETENLVLKLAPNGIIYGKVLDEAGEPVRRANVTLYYDDHSEGVDQIRDAQNAITDDLGAYEMTSLSPGTYYLSASAQPWYAVHPASDVNQAADERIKSAAGADRSLDVAYPVTYYPDVTDSDSASPIPVRGGERMEVDIHLTPVPALRVIFRVPGDNQHGYAFPQFMAQSFEGSTLVNATTGGMPSPGVVEITGIPAGRYDVRLQRQGSPLQMSEVDLTTQGQKVDTSAAEAFSEIKVRVQVPGGSKPGEVGVGLRSKRKTNIRGARLDEKGEADLPQIPAGQYELFVWGRGKSYSIASMSADGAEVSGHTLTVTAGSSPSIAVTAVAGSVVVEGTAKRAGKPFAGAMVVLVPKNVEGNRDLFRRDQSDLDGSFSLRDVTPGSYTLVAIENGWDLDWSQPGVIAVYAKHGRPVEVTNTPGKPWRVATAIEVVAK